MCDIIKNIIIDRGLNITDREFKIKGMIFLKDFVLNYRDCENIKLYNSDKNETIYLSSDNIKNITNIAIDFIIAERVKIESIKFVQDFYKFDIKSNNRELKLDKLI